MDKELIGDAMMFKLPPKTAGTTDTSILTELMGIWGVVIFYKAASKATTWVKKPDHVKN